MENTMKVVVHWDLCEGNGVCASDAPEIFDIDDTGDLIVLRDDIGEDLKPSMLAAMRSCPKRALEIHE